MPHTEHHLEHAEHAQHAAHDPLDRKVAITMAIVAALLAVVAMLSHRGHTETLRLTTQANIKHTESSDLWAFFQATNIRSHEYKALIGMSEWLPTKPGADKKQQKFVKKLRDKVGEYEGKKEAKHAKEDKHAVASEAAAGHKAAGEEGTRKGGKLGKIQHKAEGLKEQAEELEEASHAVHKSVDWIDYGHLALDLALVLSTITLLTKQRGFWYIGMASAAVGAAVALVGVAGLLQQGHL
jgi:hypothetical protein